MQIRGEMKSFALGGLKASSVSIWRKAFQPSGFLGIGVGPLSLTGDRVGVFYEAISRPGDLLSALFQWHRPSIGTRCGGLIFPSGWTGAC